MFLLLLGCDQKDMPEKDATQLTYLALGDSYTIGESVDASQRYPVLLVKKLREAGYQIEDPLIIAKTGWTTDELAAGINEALKAEGVVSDFRFPDIIRLAPVALYNSFCEIWQVIDTIKKIMETNEYLKYGNERGIVA